MEGIQWVFLQTFLFYVGAQDYLQWLNSDELPVVVEQFSVEKSMHIIYKTSCKLENTSRTFGKLLVLPRLFCSSKFKCCVFDHAENSILQQGYFTKIITKSTCFILTEIMALYIKVISKCSFIPVDAKTFLRLK